jgi:hypothetical protein
LLPDQSQQKNALKIHAAGIVLFLFIPLVLFLFLRFPFGVIPSFVAAILIMIAHRFAAIRFMNRYKKNRCMWCGRTSRARNSRIVRSGKEHEFQFCKESENDENCFSKAGRFFNFCSTKKTILRFGIFLPLLWYVVTMLLTATGVIHFPLDWNRFVFQFFIACTVVAISFLYKAGNDDVSIAFPFPIHNLFLLGIKNTLLVFRYVGIWWIAAGLIFLYHER